jgi:hypothetical protein
MHDIIHYFDKLEDRIRGKLAGYPILYTLIGGIGIVMFWRGVWITTDQLSAFLPEQLLWFDGLLSIGVSVFILLISGLFVSFFINDQIILSGIKREKKLVERTEAEVREDRNILLDIERKLTALEKSTEELKSELHKK